MGTYPNDEKVPGMKGSGFVTSRTRKQIMAMVCCCMVVAPSTWAFFPLGEYDPFGVLRYQRYIRSAFDTNNNGEVEEDEGIPVYIENGKSGFTEAELEIVYESLAVWERVPQSYASTYVVGLVSDPTSSGLGEFDGINSIVLDVSTTQDLDGDGLPDENVEPDPAEVIAGIDATNILGYNLKLWAVEDSIIDVGGESYLVGAGTIIDNDIVINASAHRPASAGVEPIADLQGTLVHELGHFFGLGHSPLNNVRAELAIAGDPTSELSSVETQVMNHSIGGVRRRIGVTPTMYPFLFFTIEANGSRSNGSVDLAPDDMSGVAWMYPRGSQDLYFALEGEARTRTAPGTGLPSAQIPNGHVVAWADVDNDDTTPRVAVFSTLTSLYVNSPIYPEREGRFELTQLWKQMETESGLFNATYTFSNSPLNGSGYERQAPPGGTADQFDSIDPPTVSSFTVYPSEVYNEAGNIVDVANKDAGTPFVWDFQRQTLVSTDTDRSIESTVGSDPMFGDPNDVCILNVVSSAKAAQGGAGFAGAAQGAQSARSLRDNLLLETALGTFIVDLYYSVSPRAAEFLLSNSVAYQLTARSVQGAYWALDHYRSLLLVLLLAVVGVRALRTRWRQAATASVLLGMVAFGATSVEAQIIPHTTEQLAAKATDIVSGKVVSAQSRQATTKSLIYTDIVIEVQDKAKGSLNKQTNITLTQVGGRVGGLRSEISEFANFSKDETVILYLVYVEGHGYVVYNGLGGKVQVSVSKATNSNSVAVPEDMQTTMQKSLPTGESAPATLSVSEYMAELRAIVKRQEAEAAP